MMITAFTSNLNFQAKRIKRAPIYKLNGEKGAGYIPITGSIIEIDTKRTKDMDAVELAISKWGEEDSYGKHIIRDAKESRKTGSTSNNGKILVITLQQDNFNNLESDKILGLSEITDCGKNKIEINFLQVRPDIAGKKEGKQYINIGKCLIDMLKKIPSNTKIFVTAAYNAANFYEKMEFKIIDTDKLTYLWEKNEILAKLAKRSYRSGKLVR